MSNDASNDVVIGKKDGRPTIYSDELAKEICLRISNGRSLSSVCRDKDMPSRRTVYDWLVDEDKKDFLHRYREADLQRADYHADELIEIADSVEADTAEVAKARLQIDTRKWQIARMNATKYGDKHQVDNVSSDGSMSPKEKPDYSGLTDDELRQYIALESKVASTTSGIGEP